MYNYNGLLSIALFFFFVYFHANITCFSRLELNEACTGTTYLQSFTSFVDIKVKQMSSAAEGFTHVNTLTPDTVAVFSLFHMQALHNTAPGDVCSVQILSGNVTAAATNTLQRF